MSDNREVIGYTIHANTSLQDLIAAVQSDVRLGWQPHGSLAVIATDSGRKVMLQAMVQYRAPRHVVGAL